MNMTCRVDAMPPPELKWTINDIPVDDVEFRKDGITVTRSKADSRQVVSMLLWPAVSGFRMARVACQASNVAGQAVDSALAIITPKSKLM